MSTLITASTILANYNINKPTNEKGDQFRGTAHEFQDYAYRLASDLRDLQHLNIYMKLAKSYPRYILEEIYSYVADVNSQQKGALFMWRLKQVRKEMSLRTKISNHEHDFVQSEMAKFRDTFAEKIIAKNSEKNGNKLFDFLCRFLNEHTYKLTSYALLFGLDSKLVTTLLDMSQLRLIGMDTSRQLVSKQKSVLSKSSKSKLIKQTFRKKNFNKTFDLIVFSNLWLTVPLAYENEYLAKVSRILKTGGHFIVSVKYGTESVNKWNSLPNTDEPILYFEKINEYAQLCQKLQSNGFKVLQNNDYYEGKYSIIECVKC